MSMLAFAAIQFGDVLMIAGVLLLIVIFMVQLRRRLGRIESVDPRQQIERNRQVNSMRNDLRTMMVELEELTRQFSAQLDAKSIKLERLIEQADQRITQLGGNVEDATSSTLRRPRPSAAGGDPTNDPLTRSVYQLADAGHDPGEIAQKLEEHIGKVELILALRQHG